MVFYCSNNACRLPDKRSSEISSKDITLVNILSFHFFEKSAMLTITTCLALPEPPSNLLPLADALYKTASPPPSHSWQHRPKSAFILPLCAWDYAAEPEAFGQ